VWQLSAQSAQLKSDEGFVTFPGDCLRAVGKVSARQIF